jgi:dephospho-CoA kinase
MRVIGLTGGIASGKTTVARMFEQLGAVVIYADQVAREVVEPGFPALDAIRQSFGPEVFHPDGTLNRGALGDRVFSDPEARRRLEAITHPPILQRIKQRLAQWRQAKAGEQPPAVIIEHPLLIEAGHSDLVEGIILVVAQQSTQAARLKSDKRLTTAQAWDRIRSQLPVEAKIPHARWVIDGEATLPQVRRRVEEIWRELVPAEGRASG